MTLVGCAEPFDETRQELASFRIAALGVQDGTATAAIWSGEGLFHTAAPGLDWSMNGASIGSGWQVSIQGYGELGLVATAADGTEREARVSINEAPEGRLGVAREAVDGGEVLDLESRRAVTGVSVDGAVPSDSGVRLVITERQENEQLRWMLGGGVGTLLELDEDRADLLRAEVVWEEELITEREELGDGTLHALVLGTDAAGSNRWTWADAVVGEGQALARHEGRLIAVEGAAEAGWLAVTLAAGEGLAGVGFVDAVPVTDLAEQEALDCASRDEPFRLAWLAEGRCLLGDVLGARVVVEVW